VARVIRGTELPPGVQIRRDRWGVAHVRAPDAAGAFFAQGVVDAEDRLWQLDLDRMRAYGRSAELLGPAGLESDRAWRRLDVASVVAAEYAGASERARRMFDAYAAGLNAAVRAGGPSVEHAALGVAPRPFLAQDAMAVFKFRHLDMTGWTRKFWWGRVARHRGLAPLVWLARALNRPSLAILPPGTRPAAPVLDLAPLPGLLEAAEALDGGSNNWALSGARTGTGRPIVAGDPHRAVEVPNVYHPFHVACPEFDVIGLTFPGVPGFAHFGHNARVAWCITHTGAEGQDLYLERLDGPDVVRRTEILAVRGGDAQSLTCLRTPRGPVIAAGSDGMGIAWRATSLEPVPEQWDALVDMLAADSAAALQECMRPWVDPVNNLLAADIDGHIGYLMRGRIPIRHMDALWLPVPGWDDRYAWRGFVPFDALPRVLDPDAGMIVTANNRVVGPDYPHPIALLFAAPHRAERLFELLAARSDWQPDDMPALHTDILSRPARRLTELLADVNPRCEAERDVLAHLCRWDGRMERDGSAPLLYSHLRDCLAADLFQDLFGRLAEDRLDPQRPGALATYQRLRAMVVDLAAEGVAPPDGTPSWTERLAAAVAATAAWAAGRPDEATRTWGEVHVLAAAPAAAAVLPSATLVRLPDTPLPGDGDTVRAAAYGSGSFRVTLASVARYVFDLSDWDRSQWVVPGGVAGSGPHAMDQLGAWEAGRLLPMPYSEAAVAAALP
jgi:penicillin amidase